MLDSRQRHAAVIVNFGRLAGRPGRSYDFLPAVLGVERLDLGDKLFVRGCVFGATRCPGIEQKE